jgi:hypothetical protein
VVCVGVGSKHDCRLDPPSLRRREKGRERGARVHVQGRPSLLVGHEVRVREVARMEAPFDEHGGTLPAQPEMRRN